MIHVTPDELRQRVVARLEYFEATDLPLEVTVSPDLEVVISHPLAEVHLRGTPEFAQPAELTQALDRTILHLAEVLHTVHRGPPKE